MTMIEDYGLIGDLHTAALVSRAGAVEWWCVPRFDSAACFAALLHDETAGSWSLAPTGSGPATRRRYRADSLVLESEWDTSTGTVRVIDFTPPREDVPRLVRIVEGVRGRVSMKTALRLRMDYGSIVPWVRSVDDGDGPPGIKAVAGPDAVWLESPVPVQGEDLATTAEFEVAEGDRLAFVLTYGSSYAPRPDRKDPEDCLRSTERTWADWIAQMNPDVDDRWSGAVRRSAILLKALTYAPSGGIVAAATTSLPEQIGGSRNWDYRYCWLRDATFTLQALLGTGYRAEAKAWREWLLRAAAGDPADLQIMYAIDGTRRLPESELDWLPGLEGSSPVRVGNAASGQFQLDVWGEVLDGLHLARTSGLEPQEATWDLQRVLLDYLEGHWSEPDNSLWEVRGQRRQFVHSKVMAWAGVDRGVQAVQRFGLDGPLDRWKQLRGQIHAEVCDQGFDADRNTFTQSYGSSGLDAALLLIPRVGFLPYEDPRVVGTIEAIQRELDHHGFLLRYQSDADVDGLDGQEGAFLACTFWLCDALHGIGRVAEATSLFEKLLEVRNDLGLLSEEYDPVARRQLGNTPQAFSHVGLINTALRLSSAGPS